MKTDNYPEEVRGFLKRFFKKYSLRQIADKINDISRLKVLILGDGIIDEYHYCESLGKSAKAPLVVNRFLSQEVFAGGAFAIANHLAGLCDDVQLVSLLGKTDSREEFIRHNLKPNVQLKFFSKDGPTIIKKRYINQYLNQKLFEVNYLNDSNISAQLETEIISYLKKPLSLCDIVLISDFGHGFITPKIIKFIEKNARSFAVNTQTNAANAGYNMITKYRNPTYVCLDEPELRWAAQEKYADIEKVARKILKAIKPKSLIVTLGKSGSLGINASGQLNRTPIFSTMVIDTVGAGDAFFSFTAPCLARGMALDLVSFIGNVVGALAVQIVCNKKPVEKEDVFEFIRSLPK